MTACALTHTTERATRRLGPVPFLPRLFADRFTHLGGISKVEFRKQLDGCRSFEDATWAGYWEALADRHLATADAALAELGGPRTNELLGEATVDVRALGELLAPAVTILADRDAAADPLAAQRFCTENPAHSNAAIALDSLIKAMTYEFVAAWPGWSPRRLRAYERSHVLGEILLTALASAMGVTIELVDIPFGDGDRVRGYFVIPNGVEKPPVVLVTNGVEGTLAEALLPLLKYRSEGMAMFVMEMPGTYAYREPLSPAAERVYTRVIDVLAGDPRVDGERIGMMGLSFGAYWATRMAAVDPRLKAAVANGAPTNRSFGPLASFGLPEIMVSTLSNAAGATGMADTLKKLRAMPIADYYARILIPLLVINGAEDTLVSTQDSIDIAIGAPHGELVLYDGDDHCAMGHGDDWMKLSHDFFRRHLVVADGALRS
ncbi:alpha/beta hydrolase family protein [Mycobacterium sp. C31M]